MVKLLYDAIMLFHIVHSVDCIENIYEKKVNVAMLNECAFFSQFVSVWNCLDVEVMGTCNPICHIIEGN